jgi:DNA invertase Pin-like site-specific DNA recombinase
VTKQVGDLADARAEFAAADMPDANRMTLHILSAIAEGEAKAISDRTRAALAALKRCGMRLGSHHPRIPALTARARRKGQAIGSQENRDAALDA